MKKLSCFLRDFEPFGMFIGCSLLESENSYKKVLKSVEFYYKISKNLENFLEYNEYSRENLEKWFNRLVNI